MKKIIAIASLIAAALLAGRVVFAQTTLIYPVAPLGNCRDAKECFYYCEIPDNHAACWSFDQYVLGSRVLSATTTSITFPIAELGNCNSFKSCAIFCDQPQNKDICTSFATQHGMTSPPNPNKERLLSYAKEFLGCNDYDSCKAFCQNPDHRQKCYEFAQKIKSTINPPPPNSSLTAALFEAAKSELGCDSEVSCKSFCSLPENHQKCQDFAQKHNLGHRPNLDSPTATKSGTTCTNNQECYKYCQSYPGKCPGFPKPTQTTSTP